MSCAATSAAALRPPPPRASPRGSAASSSSLAFWSGRRHGFGAASLWQYPPAALRRRRGGGRGATCALTDLIGGDLVRPDLGRWLSDVEEHKAVAIYPPHEGGYEGRYLIRLRHQGYRFLDVSARGLGDPEATLTQIHPVCPPHLGRQPIARWYFPPEVDYRLSLLPPEAKGLVVWVIEAKVQRVLHACIWLVLAGAVEGGAAVPGAAAQPAAQGQGRRRVWQLEKVHVEATERDSRASRSGSKRRIPISMPSSEKP